MTEDLTPITGFQYPMFNYQLDPKDEDVTVRPSVMSNT